MSGLEKLLTAATQQVARVFELPSCFNASEKHSTNQADRSKLKVLHAALEYGMPNNPNNIAVGGVGSMLQSLVIAQTQQTDVDTRVIMPYYPRLHSKITAHLPIVALQVKHWFKGKHVNSSIYKTANKDGAIEYWIKADDCYAYLFDEIYVAASIYSNNGDKSKFIERISYFCSAVAAFAMIGENDYLPHVVQGHSWGLAFIGQLIKQYRIACSASGEGVCSPRTIFTVHSSHYGDGAYTFDELPDIGLPKPNSRVSLALQSCEHYDHLVYVSPQLLKETLLNPSAFSGEVFRRYAEGNTTAILNNIFTKNFDPAGASSTLPPEIKELFQTGRFADAKKALKIYANANILPQFGKNILTDRPVTLYLGRYSSEKGVDKLDQALMTTLANGGTFICMGVGSCDELSKLRAAHGHKPQVIIFDSHEQQKLWGNIFRALADIYLVPSKEEACGLVPMEAGVMGAFVVSSSAGGLVNVVIPDANGARFLGQEDLSGVLTNLQNSWLELHRSGNLNLAMQLVRESAIKTFDWHAEKVGSAEEYKNLYKTLLRGAGAIARRQAAHETELTLSILKDREMEDISSVMTEESVSRRNDLDISPLDLAVALGKHELAAAIENKIRQALSLKIKPRSLDVPGNINILQMCYEYNQIKLGGVGEVVTALSQLLNQNTNRSNLNTCIITPHYPAHDDLIRSGALTEATEACRINHMVNGRMIISVVTRVVNEFKENNQVKSRVVQFLVRPENNSDNEFLQVTTGNHVRIFDDFLPKMAYFNSAVAALVVAAPGNQVWVRGDINLIPAFKVVNGHSWGCALVPKLLKERYMQPNVKFALTVHSEFSEQGVITPDTDKIECLHKLGVEFTKGISISCLQLGMRESDLVIYVSEDLQQQALRHGGFFSIAPVARYIEEHKKGKVIMNGINNTFDPVRLPTFNAGNMLEGKKNTLKVLNDMMRGSDNECFQDKALDVEQPLILFVGRFLHEKGIDNIEPAIEEAVRLGANFVVMGLYGGQKEDDVIRDLARKYKDNKKVVILHEKSYDQQRKFGPFFRYAATFTFVPSHRESCGLVPPEGMLNGSWGITSNAGGLKDSVKEGTTGFLYENGHEGMLTDGNTKRRNTAEVHAAVRRAIEFYRQLSKAELSKRMKDLYHFAKDNFIWDAEKGSLNKYHELYSTLARINHGQSLRSLESPYSLPSDCLQKLSPDARNIKERLPEDYVAQMQFMVGKGVVQIPGYKHYLLRTKQGDIVGIFANGLNGASKQPVVLGSGATATVYLGQVLYSEKNIAAIGKFVAVKEIRSTLCASQATDLRLEKSMLLQAGDLVFKCLDEHGAHKYIYQKVHSGKILKQILNTSEISLTDKVFIALSAAEELMALHARNILHLDIHEGNILVERKSRPSINMQEIKQVKLIDYGASRILADNQTSVTLDGLPEYADTEVFEHRASKSTDVYMLGYCFANMLVGYFGVSSETLAKQRAIGDILSDRAAFFVSSLRVPERQNLSLKDKKILFELQTVAADMLSYENKDRLTINNAVTRLRDIWNNIQTGVYDDLSSVEVPGYALPKIERNSPLYKYLVANGFNNLSDLNAKNAAGYTPLTSLFLAEGLSTNDRLNLIRDLVGLGANVNGVTKYNLPPLFFALTAPKFDEASFAYLVRLGADLNRVVDLKLDSSKVNTIKLYKFYIENRFGFMDKITFNEGGHTPLTKAASLGDIEMMKLILQKNPRLLNARSRYGYTALHIALVSNQQKAMDFLLEQQDLMLHLKSNDGFSIDQCADNFILRERFRAHLRKVAAGKDMHDCIIAKDYNAMFALAALKPELKVANYTLAYNSLQQRAAFDDDFLRFLFEHQFKVDAVSEDENIKKLFNLFKYLQANNFSIHNADAYNPTTMHTPLTLAVNENKIDICTILLEGGAGVNVPNALGNTPLHIAIDNNCKQLVEILLLQGANKQTHNDNGVTPMDILQEKYGTTDLARWLSEGAHRVQSSTLSMCF